MIKAETNKTSEHNFWSHVNIFLRSWISMMEIPGWEPDTVAHSQCRGSGLSPTMGHQRVVLTASSQDSTRFDGSIIYQLLSVVNVNPVKCNTSVTASLIHTYNFNRIMTHVVYFPDLKIRFAHLCGILAQISGRFIQMRHCKASCWYFGRKYQPNVWDVLRTGVSEQRVNLAQSHSAANLMILSTRAN